MRRQRARLHGVRNFVSAILSEQSPCQQGRSVPQTSNRLAHPSQKSCGPCMAGMPARTGTGAETPLYLAILRCACIDEERQDIIANDVLLLVHLRRWSMSATRLPCTMPNLSGFLHTRYGDVKAIAQAGHAGSNRRLHPADGLAGRNRIDCSDTDCRYRLPIRIADTDSRYGRAVIVLRPAWPCRRMARCLQGDIDRQHRRHPPRSMP